MNRQQALDWCVENVTKWENSEVLHNVLDVKKRWGFYLIGGQYRMFNVSNQYDSPITKQDWLDAKVKKEQPYMSQVGEEMKNDLMMKAVIQFGGVWPIDAEHLVTTGSKWQGGEAMIGTIEVGRFEHVIDGEYCWVILSTKKQFEDFVESIEERAFPFAPTTGEECEFSCGGKWFSCEFIGKRSSGNLVLFRHDEGEYFSYHQHQVKFRPLKTERRELIEIIDSCNMSSGVLADAILNAGYRKSE